MTNPWGAELLDDTPDAETPSAADVPANGTLVATRVADVLALFLDSATVIGVTEISRSLGISKAVAHRIVRSLVSRDLLAVAPRARYSLGPAAAALGLRASRESSLWRAASPPMRDIAAELGVTVALSARIGAKRCVLRQLQHSSTRHVNFEIGSTVPLLPGTTGFAMAAFLSEPARNALLIAWEAAGESREAGEARLEQAQRDGYAFGAEQSSGRTFSLAAPVFGFGAEVVGALTVAAPEERFGPRERQDFTGALVRHSSRISAAMVEFDGAW